MFVELTAIIVAHFMCTGSNPVRRSGVRGQGIMPVVPAAISVGIDRFESDPHSYFSLLVLVMMQ